MEDNNKPSSEFEKIANESSDNASTEVNSTTNVELPKEKNDEIQIVDDSKSQDNIEEKKDDSTNEKVEENKDVNEESKESSSEEDIQIVDDGTNVDLPQTKEQKESSIPSNIDTSNQDSQTIGTIKPDKQKSPFAMLFLFGVLIVFILFMPTAISLFNKYFGTDLNIDSLNNPQNTNQQSSDDTNNDKQDIKMYDLKDDTVIQIGKIDFGGFKKDNLEGFNIAFYVKNNGTVLYKFEKKMYLEYYDDNNTFVGRSYLESLKEITGGITNNYRVKIDNNTYNNATKVEVVQRTDDDYPAVELVNNQLTCTNETDNLVYTFDDSSRLTNIKDIYTYIKDDDVMKYSNDLITYKTKISNLDALDGVTAILTETDNGFITTTAIDYQFADYSKLSSNTNYYVKDTYAKTISFEMNAKGYNCR